MKRFQRLLCVFVLALLCRLPSVLAEQTGSTALRVDTAGRPAAAETPVSSGVTFPTGAVATVDHLRLETSQGTEVSANYWKLVSWPDGSVKSALISLVPAVQGDAYGSYVLRYGPSVGHTSSGPVQVTQDSQTLTITTDVMKLQFSKGRFTILEQAWTDLNDDGKFDANERWLESPADLIVTDRKTEGKFRSSLWTATDGYAPQLVEFGPEKVTVLLEGRLKGENGALTVEKDSTIAQAKVWVTVHAGSTLLHLQTTIVDNKSRPTEEFSSAVMHLDGVAVEFPSVLRNATYYAGGENSAVYQGQVGSEAYLLQNADESFNSVFSYRFSYKGVGVGGKAPGWMCASGGGRGVALGIRHFWQNFPQKLLIRGDGVLRLEFLPTDGSQTFWTVYPGVGKTYEGFIDFHKGEYTTTVRRRIELALTPPLLLAGGAWYSTSEAFGELSVPSGWTRHWENKMENQYRCTVLREGCSIYPQIYGQRNFGDYVAGIGTRSDGTTFPEYGDGHYEDAHGFLLQFARTSDRRWFDYAVTNARHHYDLDVMHAQNPPRYPGYPPGMIHWHGTSEHEGVNIELGHVVPGGLDEYYMLTGDPRAIEVIREQGDWVEYWARTGGGRIAPERPQDNVGYEEYERVGAWTLYTLVKSYEATGDPKYWEGASIVVKNMIDWWRMPQDHIVFDPGRKFDYSQPPKDQALFYERSDWTQGNGYPLPTLRVANCAQTTAPLQNYAFQSHAPIAWMSGLMQMALVRYYQDLERRGGVYDATVRYRWSDTPIHIDLATMREMLIQVVNTIIDFNYVGAPKYPSRYPWLSKADLKNFVYSVCPERDFHSVTGGQYLSWPILFVSSFRQDEVSPRWQSKWPELQAKWREIIQDQYRQVVIYRQNGDTSSNGAGEVLTMPYAVARLEKLGLLSVFSDGTPPPPPPPPSGGGDVGGTLPPPPPTGSGGTPPPSSGSQPGYQVSINEGSLFVTNPLIDLRLVAPSQATEVNASTTGFGQGKWQQTAEELHGFTLPAGPGTKMIYVQFRDAQGKVLASLIKSVVLIASNSSVQADLVLNDSEDSYVFSNSPSSNFGNQSMVTFGKYDTGYDNVGLFRFAIPAVPSGVTVTVKEASLDVYLLENTRNTNQAITPYELTSNWTEDGVTWGNRPTLAATPMGNALNFFGRSETFHWKSFTLAPAAVQAWFQDPAKADGIGLSGNGVPALTSLQVSSSEAFNSAEDRRPRLSLKLDISVKEVGQPTITNVQVMDIGETTATISWVTEQGTDGSVDYGTTSAYGQTGPKLTELSKNHEVKLSGLTAKTLYHVRATSRDVNGNRLVSGDVTFTTSSGALAGDLNGDGRVTLADLPLLLSQIVGLSSPTPEKSDVNGDGQVNIADLQSLVNRL